MNVVINQTFTCIVYVNLHYIKWQIPSRENYDWTGGFTINWTVPVEEVKQISSSYSYQASNTL